MKRGYGDSSYEERERFLAGDMFKLPAEIIGDRYYTLYKGDPENILKQEAAGFEYYSEESVKYVGIERHSLCGDLFIHVWLYETANVRFDMLRFI